MIKKKEVKKQKQKKTHLFPMFLQSSQKLV